ncbi:MAG: hypothetical protein ACTHJ3_05605 [Pararhizobium sp.]
MEPSLSAPRERGMFGFDPASGRLRFGRRSLTLPRSRMARIAIGGLLVLGGVFSFLPILGIWMLPLGLLVLSQDVPLVRRWRRRATLWHGRRRRARKAA